MVFSFCGAIDPPSPVISVVIPWESLLSERLSRSRETSDWPSMSMKPGATMRPLASIRSEEHTSELQSQSNLVCRLLLEKKNRVQLCHAALVWLRSAHSAALVPRVERLSHGAVHHMPSAPLRLTRRAVVRPARATAAPLR